MQTFSDAGIYVFLDLDTFNTYILEDDAHWNQTQFDAYSAVMDEFHTYDNVAGFFIGNEVIQHGNYSSAAVYIKSATRDLKNYRNQKGYRNIPVGYSHADIASLRPNLQNYLACGTNADDSIDFFGLNAYEWCGNVNFMTSGYDTLQTQAMDYPIPIFLSETGCNQPEPRDFQDQTAVFGPEMGGTWSGAIIYEWIQEANGYGLVAYDSMLDQGTSTIPGTASIPRSGTPIPVTPDYSNLKKVWASVTPSSVSSDAYRPTLTAPPCPAYTSGVWEINGDASLPALGQTLNAQQSASVTAGSGMLDSVCPSGYNFVGNATVSLLLPAPSLKNTSKATSLPLTEASSGPAPTSSSTTGAQGAASGGKVSLPNTYQPQWLRY